MFDRLFLALVADLKGWNRVYLFLNWLRNLLSTFIYFVANSIPMFLMSKIAGAMKESSYWAINRIAIFSVFALYFLRLKCFWLKIFRKPKIPSFVA